MLHRPMRKSIIVGIFLCTLNLLSSANAAGTRNDGIYPPTDAAKPFIDFDGKGFIVNGQHIYLASGSMHYARVPHELWADRLLRLKQAAFNGVQTYTFWNYHEPVEGQWNFSGDGDLESYLDTAQKIGLYATVRVGPYVCAEWDSGGYPVWLKFLPDLTAVRTNNPTWMALNDHWYDKIIPIVAKHQIDRGGNVILVQLENEHPKGWGVLPDDPYFVHLHDTAVKDGIEIPHFMSGMHHGGNPSPANLDPSKHTTPWYTTEFWAGWFDEYRAMPAKKFKQIVTANWAIMAHGGAGQNYYMAHGGSNFASWSDYTTAASYDYGAAIGQAGDLRPLYYQMKRANQLAQSFPGIIGNSTDALGSHGDFATGEHVAVEGARQSDAGTIVFLQNQSDAQAIATFKSGETLHMNGNSHYPFPEDTVLTKDVKIVDSTVPVLGVAHNDHVVTVIVYGQPGDSGRMHLAMADGAKFEMMIKIPAVGVEESDVARPDFQTRVLAVSDELSLYTWILGPSSKQDVIVGPAYVQEVRHAEDGKVSVVIERPYGQPSSGQVAVYGAKDQSWHLRATADTAIESQPAPALASWKMISTTQAAPNYDDSNWKQSAAPLQMGADGDYGAFAWYRTVIDLPSQGSGTLKIKGADNLEVFVNGDHVEGGGKSASWIARFSAGKNSIAVFASHRGRKDAYNYLGRLDNYDSKGILGPVSLEIGGQNLTLTGWKLKGGLGADPPALTSWHAPAQTHGIPAFYQATFTTTPPAELGAHPILRVNYKGLTRGMYWVNGHNLGRYPEKIPIDSLYIPECWLKDGENVLTVFDETGASPTQVQIVVEQPASREVIRAAEAVSPTTPIVVPTEIK